MKPCSAAEHATMLLSQYALRLIPWSGNTSYSLKHKREAIGSKFVWHKNDLLVMTFSILLCEK